jgi:hypothetical protein
MSEQSLDDGEASPSLEIGDRVTDSNDAEHERSAARVVDVLGAKASDHRIEAIGKTVAEVNPDHPPEAAVVAIRFERATGKPGGATYHYPATRLEAVSDEWEPAPTLTEGQRERQQLIDENPEAIGRFADVVAQLLRAPAESADDLARAIDNVDLSPDDRDECRFTRDDRYRPDDDAAIVCWQCNAGGQRPMKYRTTDPPGEDCERARIDAGAFAAVLDEWGADPSPAGEVDVRDADRDCSRLQDEDDDRVRLGALRLAYRLSGLEASEEYNYGRATALLRDVGIASELPLLDASSNGGETQ